MVSANALEERELALPLRALVEIENADAGADVWGSVIADDTQHYIVKGTRSGESVPASEWVGTHLADLLRLPVPTPRIIRMSCGTLLFGSRDIGLAADKTETSAMLTSETSGSKARPVPGLAAVLSKIYAFDLFVNNRDRHDWNYLSVATPNGDRRFYIIDLARSLFSTDLESFPQPTHPTRIVGKKIRQLHGFSEEAAFELLEHLTQLAPRAIIRIIQTTPEAWLSDHDGKKFADWWASEERLERIRRVREGLSDGSLL